MARQRDDRNVPGALVLLEPARCLPPVHPRQSQIHEDDIRHQLNCLLYGFDAVGRLGDAVAGERQVGRVHLAGVLIVLDDEHERLGIACVHGFPPTGAAAARAT
jgi:hypothetical protein